MNGANPDVEQIAAIVARARQRASSQLAFREAIIALMVALAGPLLLLVAGTNLFPVAALWAFPLFGVLFAFYRWKRSIPQPYQVAQRLDARWRSEDQISTAYFYKDTPPESSLWLDCQRGLASRAGSSRDIAAALPSRIPFAAWGLAAMILLCLGLVGLRLALQPTLSLQPPLPPAVARALWGWEDRTEPSPPSPNPEPSKARQSEPLAVDEEGETIAEEARRRAEASRQSPPEKDADAFQQGEGDFPMPEVEGLSLDDEYGDELATAAASEADPALADQRALKQETLDSIQDSERAAEQSRSSETQAGAGSEESQDLLSRLKEAFENMLSSLDIDASETASQGGSSEQSSEMTQMGAESGQMAEGQGQPGGQGAQPAESSMSASSESPGQMGQGGEQGSEQGVQGEATSSAGSNEGSKEIARVEQLEAMGELRELLNKRAAEISGEVMVETEASKQALQTPYAQRESGHSDPRGTVSRDEIPLAYRSFIQAYFKNLREQNNN